MPSNKSEGSQLTVITTEHTLATVTDAGNYLLKVDLNVMALGDIVELRVKSKVRSTGTTRLMDMGVYTNVQDSLISVSIPDATVEEIVVTLTQTAGSVRTFDWALVDLS